MFTLNLMNSFIDVKNVQIKIKNVKNVKRDKNKKRLKT